MRRRRLPATVAVIATLAAACSGSAARSGDPPADAYRAMREGLCASLGHAEDRDPATAGRAFRGQVHQALHVLADATSEIDRAAAARLLETKQQVRSSLHRHDPDLPRHLRDLITATRTALSAVGQPSGPPCDDQEHRP